MLNRIVLGIDAYDRWEVAAGLVQALDFPDPHIKLVHVAEGIPPTAWTARNYPGHVKAAMQVVEQQAQNLLQKASEQCQEMPGLEDVTLAKSYNVPESLLSEARSFEAGLIAIGSSGKGPLEALISGSAARGLAIDGEQSFLVAKQPVKSGDGLRAVLAVDHSEYSLAAAEMLASSGARGIRELTILTAMPSLPSEIMSALSEANAGLCRRFEAVVGSVHSSVSDLEPKAAIREEMSRTGADLLILGARGAGFLKRLTLGSVSFHQVTAEPHSVLVLRPRA